MLALFLSLFLSLFQDTKRLGCTSLHTGLRLKEASYVEELIDRTAEWTLTDRAKEKGRCYSSD